MKFKANLVGKLKVSICNVAFINLGINNKKLNKKEKSLKYYTHELSPIFTSHAMI